MKNIKIGIVQLTPGWQIILEQIGVNFRQLSKDNQIDPAEYSLLVINSVEFNLDLLQEWFKINGAVLWESDAYCQLYNFPKNKKRIKYIIPKAKFRHLGIIDFYCDFHYPCDNSLYIEDRKLGIAQKENMTCLPFKLDDLILNTSVMRKRFYANRTELPSEQVSRVSKGKIRKLVQQIIEDLHHKQNLPFVHKWFFPRDARSVFILRVDTDFCSKDDANELLRICKKHNINGSWFLDTESDIRLSDTYSKFTTQELGLHCDVHLVFNELEQNMDNLNSGLAKLQKHNIIPEGFVAPFGQWNSSLGQALEDLDFNYSSEFAIDYDDLPFYPYFNNHFSRVLQIPIHPISIGRLRRSHFSENEMLQYYMDFVKEKSKFGEPVIIYHHPHHKHFDIFDKIFQFVNSENFENMSMKEFSKWWVERYELNAEFQYINNKLSVKNESENVFVRISTKDGYTISQEKDIQIDRINLKPYLKPFMKRDLNRIRKFHWRDLLYNYESRKSKKVFK